MQLVVGVPKIGSKEYERNGNTEPQQQQLDNGSKGNSACTAVSERQQIEKEEGGKTDTGKSQSCHGGRADVTKMRIKSFVKSCRDVSCDAASHDIQE
mmetsp:Transcript_7128/g.8121  ORF Transcript_7128/g.8121 Transcript_7128/m.8121 type:complete len:97 (+) Transcript_7128:540-830(+)